MIRFYETLEVLNNISTEEFQKCFQQWDKLWHKCIESKGEYFEGYQICDRTKPNKPFKKKSCYFGVPPSYVCLEITQSLAFCLRYFVLLLPSNGHCLEDPLRSVQTVLLWKRCVFLEVSIPLIFI